MRDQLIQLMKTENLTATRLADEIGIQPSSISHVLSGRNKPSYDFIIKIIERFESVNATWLLTGKGTMKKESSVGKNGIHETEVNTSNSTEKLTNKDLATDEFYSASAKEHEKNLQQISKITKVNKIFKIVTLFQDGSFLEYIPANE